MSIQRQHYKQCSFKALQYMCHFSELLVFMDQLGSGLHDQQAAVCEDPQCLLILHSPEHWLPSGLCAESPPVHAAYIYTAVVGCITNNDEASYRKEVEQSKDWCRKNKLDEIGG